MGELTAVDWALLVTGAVLVGIAKTALSGAGTLAVVAFATALPARASTGVLVPLLLLGDVIAVRTYHRHANWSILARLAPGVLPGLAVGAWFLSVSGDSVVRRTIGAIVVAMALLQLRSRRTLRQRLAAASTPDGHAMPPEMSVRRWRGASLLMGLIAGFATMTANAAGPVTSLYLVMAGLPMLEMLGTVAWFYLAVNAAKLPFSAGADVLSFQGLAIDAALVPALIVGALAGRAIIARIDQQRFEGAVLVLTLASGSLLLL